MADELTEPIETNEEWLARQSCQFRWKQWPDKRCPARPVGDEHCSEHERIIRNRDFRSGAKKSVSPAQKAHYKRFWASRR